MDNFDITTIYEALDENREGYISLEVLQSFIEEFQRHSPDSEQLDNFSSILIKKADGNGQIHMEDFQAAIQELQEMDSQKTTAGAELTPSNSVELHASQETLVDPAVPSQTSWSTPTMHKSPSLLSKDDSNDTHSDSGVHDCVSNLDQIIAENEDGSPAVSPRSNLRLCRRPPLRDLLRFWRDYYSLVKLSGPVPGQETEESYEDFGESENDFSLITADNASDVGRRSPAARLLKPPPHPGPRQQLSVRPDPDRGTWPRRRQRSGGDFPRDSVYNYAGPWQQHSAARQAHDLYSSSLNGSPYSSYSEGLAPDLSSAHFEDIQEQLASLASQVSHLSNSQLETSMKNNKLAEANSLMKEQISSLEDQLKYVENKSSGSFDTEKRNLQHKMERIDRDRSEELSSLRSRSSEELRERLHTLETESAEARLEAMRYKSEAERLKLEKLRAEEKLSSAEEQVRSLNDERSRYLDIHRRELDCVKKERDHYNHLLEDMSRQQEEGRLRVSPASDLKLGDIYERFREAQEVVKRLTKENRGIREQLEETQAELLTRTLEQGKSLMQRSEASLAAELDSCTKDEPSPDDACELAENCPHRLERKKLMEILVKEKDANQKLRGYIDNILTRIIEQYPALLEVCAMQH